MNLNEFFNELAGNASRLYKIERLKDNYGNKQLQRVLHLALDPFTQFYIRKIPTYTPNHTDHAASLDFALNDLYAFSSREVTGNAAIDRLSNLLSAISADDAKVIERIIQKDLKCGIAASTVNSVWTDMIHEYPVMLCSQFKQKLVDEIKFPAYVQTKMDGMRFNAIVRDGKVEYRSRNGKELQLLGNLDDQFVAMANGVDCIFDGELLVVDSNGIMDRQTGNGILSKANKGTISVDEAAMVHATVWDFVPYLYFVEGYYGSQYKDRWELLNKLWNIAKPSKIDLVQSWTVDTYEEAKTLFEQLMEAGEEGIILKDMIGVWENKRSKAQVKFKGELECDLKIVGIKPHKKHPDWLGSVECESEDGVIEVSVGSGFDEDQRKILGKEIIGKIVAVKYNMRIKDKNGKESLFLPIVIEIREDKDVADNSGDIK